MNQEQCDIAIVGGGPAGLQAALVLARTRKHVIVFDAPEPPRNSASHGVHNFLGLDGLLPEEIRAQAWQQIAVYEHAHLRTEAVIDVQATDDQQFVVTVTDGSTMRARQVILAMGFRDSYPDVPGYRACWGNTIIACPYCDGYENRDRVWGIVADSQPMLAHMPMIFRNWTSAAKIILTPNVTLAESDRVTLLVQGITIHAGDIAEVHHVNGKVEGVTLTTGENVDVGTLLWRPAETPLPLTQRVIEQFNLTLDERGYIKTDGFHQTEVEGLWAVGDIRGWAGSLDAAQAGGLAAVAITRTWYAEHTAHAGPTQRTSA